MSRSSFSKSSEEIANLGPMEMTFTIKDADLDKLNDVLKDINVKECPWFEVQDKHGNKAKYYREPQWIPCSERLPEPRIDVWCNSDLGQIPGFYDETTETWYRGDYLELLVNAWMPLPEPYQPEEE